MRTVWRFEIDMQQVGDTQGYFTLNMPLGSIPLHVAAQERAPYRPSLWALVEDDRQLAERRFLLTGTGAQGHEPPASKSEYVGTFQDAGFVWHVWEASP